jgi:hypothetical protein
MRLMWFWGFKGSFGVTMKALIIRILHFYAFGRQINRFIMQSSLWGKFIQSFNQPLSYVTASFCICCLCFGFSVLCLFVWLLMYVCQCNYLCFGCLQISGFIVGSCKMFGIVSLQSGDARLSYFYVSKKEPKVPP